MERTNTFDARPLSHRDRLLLLELLDASAACNNQINYERRQAYFHARNNGSHTTSELKDIVWNATTQEKYRQRYIQQLGSSTPQQLYRKNNEAWRSFFELLSKYRDPDDDTVTDEPSPPGYWKDDDKRRLHTCIRQDGYTVQWGERSRLEIVVGTGLKEKYGLGYHDRLRLEIRGDPRWRGKQRRLELTYNRDAESFTAHQPVERAEPRSRHRRDYSTTLAATPGEEGVVAAVDIGANNLAAVATSEGDTRLYHGRPEFDRFRECSEEIDHLQSELAYGEWSSRRIRELYQLRGDRRDHAMDALVRDLAGWLAEHDVRKLFVGDLSGVLRSHWSARVNEKTHLFWAHGRFRERLEHVLEGEYGIEVEEESEGRSSSRCPECDSEVVNRGGDLLQCLECGFEGHSDVAGAVNFLQAQVQAEKEVDALSGSMARPAVSGQNRPCEKGHRLVPCLEWNDHEWRRSDRSTKEESANRSTREGKLASGESA
ncbi:IS200/IS605 family transposon protein TnpB [Natronococcus pandeyae]|uniref:IS200/IS605 family transposon protein TnpB n=1 Tax=Natronococcus pandeyae TaxID=2055836 RepID=A0A8J8TR49_9EURY|nr:RNA-guided endonuclease TnpB family protein [Natronococcus pandeyae]TYL37192.1 IS200/IS605 family transposon protein TnpB [Natronococcus pandeyae]